MAILCCVSWGLLVATAGAPAAIELQGDATCPSPAEVSAALTGLLAPPAAQTAPDVVQLMRAGDGQVIVSLRRKSGPLIAEKRLPEALSCAERAQTAAVLVAAWQARLGDGELALGPPTEISATAPPRSIPPPAARETETASPPPEARLATAADRPPQATLSVEANRAPPVPPRIDVDAALLASVNAAGAAPAATLGVALERRNSSLALGLDALLVGSHTAAVGPGSATWRRLGGVFDLRSNASTSWPAVGLQAHAGLALTAVEIAGRSYPTTAGTTVFDPGLMAGLRARLRTGRLQPWLEATAAFWPRPHQIYVGDTSDSAEIPRLEALLGAGVTIDPAR